MTERETLYDSLEGENMRTPQQVAYNRSLRYKEFLQSEYWLHVRRFMAKRRGCSQCGARDKRLDVHHKTYEHLGDELNHLEDLIVLCEDCHKGRHASGNLRGPLDQLIGEFLADMRRFDAETRRLELRRMYNEPVPEKSNG